MENCIFLNKFVSGSLHRLLSQVYLYANTRFASNGFLKISTYNTSIYGSKSFETLTVTS